MKSTQKAVAIAAVLVVVGAFAAQAAADGFIVPVRPEIRVRGHWAVKYHHVSVKVRDQVAAVSIDQEFVNTGRGMIEVEYLFPVPPGAAVDAMTLVVGGKEYTARLLKADEARKIYNDIVRRKKDPALLEYAGFGLYRTKAFPLEPGKPVRVVVNYKGVCKKDRDLVEVWYPLNTEKFSAKPLEDCEVVFDIKTKADCTAVYSPTHDVTIKRKDPRHVIATYHEKKALPNRDIVVYYKAANEKVGATLLTHQPKAGQDGYFMLLVSPNPRESAAAVAAKDVVCVLDTSGSMSGKRIEQACEALGFILKNLNSRDRFNLVIYNDSIETFFEGMIEANKANIAKAADMVDRIEASGGTNIHGALQTALKVLTDATKGKSPRPAYVIFLTDGLPTVGNVNEKDILADTKKSNTCGARIFALGVGYNVNVRLLDKLVIQNRGRSDYVKEKEPVETKVSSLYNKIKNPVMTDLKLKVEGVKLRDLYPRELGDLFDGDQIVAVGRYDCKDAAALKGGGKDQRPSQLVIKGIYQGKERGFEYPVGLATPGRDMRFTFVEKLWAVRRVGFLLDQIQLNGESKEVVDELVRLSMKYGIMTPYTSFLADERVKLSNTRAVHGRAMKEANGLARSYKGGRGQVDAMNRQRLNEAARAPAATGWDGRVQITGHGDVAEYEAGKRKTLATVRQSGQKAMYRRGKLWRTAELARMDIDKDADKIQTVKRYSDEYFRLVAMNTVSENQVLASQRANEDLLISLRGQVYRIK